MWGDDGTITSGVRYLYYGTATSSTNEAKTRLARQTIVQKLHARLRVAPGVGNSLVVTVRKNGVATAITCTISDANTSASDTTNSVGFAAGDDISVEINDSGASTDLQVSLEAY